MSCQISMRSNLIGANQLKFGFSDLIQLFGDVLLYSAIAQTPRITVLLIIAEFKIKMQSLNESDS